MKTYISITLELSVSDSAEFPPSVVEAVMSDPKDNYKDEQSLLVQLLREYIETVQGVEISNDIDTMFIDRQPEAGEEDVA